MSFTLAARASAFTASKAALTTRSSKTSARRARGGVVRVDAVAVEIRHEGETYTVEVADGDNILDVALDAGIDLRYDCKMGVCMMCPAKVVTGEIDQSGSMVSEDVAEAVAPLPCWAKRDSVGAVIQRVSGAELLAGQSGA